MKSILVLCRQNACRSILAEGIINGLYTEELKAFSAGSEPTEAIHPKALSVLARHHIDCSDLRSKFWDELIHQNFDVIITVCNSANKACPHFPGEYTRLHWNTPDPAKLKGTEDQIDRAFEDTFLLLKQRIQTELL